MPLDLIDEQRLQESFAPIYVTLTSVLLGLAMEDLVSQVRSAQVYDALLLGVALYGLATAVAIWTGYAFVAITQTRRPHVLDSLNVFGLSLGVFYLNTSIDRSPAFFFLAVGVYNAAALYAVHFNIGLLERALSFVPSRRDRAGLYVGIAACAVTYPILSALSYGDRLPALLERIAIFAPTLVSVHWVIAFYRFWSRNLDRARLHSASSD
jgi:hypothetical protein